VNLESAPLLRQPCNLTAAPDTQGGNKAKGGNGRQGRQGPLVPRHHLAALCLSAAILSPMRPVSLTYTGTVGVTIQDVFDLISDASRMPEWLPNCVSVVPGPSNKGRGDRHRLHFERQGRKADAVIEVIEYVPRRHTPGSRSSSAAARRPSSSSSSRAAPPRSR